MDRPAVVRLEWHHRQGVDRQARQQVVHGDVTYHRHPLDALADALGQLERIDRLVDGGQRQPVQPLGVHRVVPGSRQAGDDIRAEDRLLVEAGPAGAYFAVVQHGQESSYRGGAQVNGQTQGHLAALVAVAAAEVLIGIDHDGG